MKNQPRKGKSARRGNRPSPYTKQQKKPYKYETRISRAKPDR